MTELKLYSTTNMEKLLELIKKARFVFVCGNGGSAATAEHLSNDLFSCGIKAFCLNSNVSIITMIANDFGYEYVFSKQMELLANDEDLLIVITGSGKSKNIVNAVKKAPCKSFALVGMGGGDVIKFTDFYLTSKFDEYGKIEDSHMMLVHVIREALWVK